MSSGTSIQKKSAAAFLFPNEQIPFDLSDKGQSFEAYVVKIEQLEALTGILFDNILTGEDKRDLDACISDIKDIKEVLSLNSSSNNRHPLIDGTSYPALKQVQSLSTKKPHKSVSGSHHLCAEVGCYFYTKTAGATTNIDE